MKTLRHIVTIVLGIALPLLVQLWDRRRLTPEQRARSWNGATWGAALYAFGPLSMLGWWCVTRGWRYIPVGVLCAAAIVVAIWGVDQGMAAVLGLPP